MATTTGDLPLYDRTARKAHQSIMVVLVLLGLVLGGTAGVLLLAKSPGALRAFSEMFETRSVEKRYLAVVHGVPKEKEWTCNLPLIADPAMKGRMRIATPGKRASCQRRSPRHFATALPPELAPRRLLSL